MGLSQKRIIFYVLFYAQIAGLVALTIFNSIDRIKAGSGLALIAFGGIFGLLAGFFFLYQMILIGGARFYEKYFGLDRLARIHHTTGLVGYGFLVAHVLFIITGYSALSGTGFVAQYFQLLDSFAYVGLATVALGLLDVVIVTSIVIVRKRLKYELWYFVHLLVYSAVILAFFHQVTNGQNLLSSSLLRVYWYGLYIFAFGLVLWRRWILPIYLEFKHRFRVHKIVNEGGGVTSVYVTGKNLKSFKYKAGQFNLWQFWQKGLRTMHHPFTISSNPGDPHLRLSAKAIGDFTAKLDQLKEGTAVFISGPYGLFTKDVAIKQKRLFIAGGIGITPFLSMLSAGVQKDDVLIYAAQTRDDAVFSEEIERYKNKGLKIVYVFSNQKITGAYSGYLSKGVIKKELGKSIVDRDIWLCGPPPMMSTVEKLLIELKVPKEQVHTEKFRL